MGPCEIVSNGTPAPKLRVARRRAARHLAKWRPTRGRHRLPHGDDRRAHRSLRGRHREPVGHARRPAGYCATGGTAADALVTAQAVLGLVEPQASGVGGGGFLLYYDAASGSVQAYDGREVAPAAATENYLRWIDDADRTEPQPDARASGRSIGVPGIVRMLAGGAHRVRPDHLARLVQSRGQVGRRRVRHQCPAGRAPSPTPRPQLRVDPEAAAYFLNPDGSPKTVGTRLTNPAYAKTLGAIASDGPQAFYTGDIARDIVARRPKPPAAAPRA